MSWDLGLTSSSSLMGSCGARSADMDPNDIQLDNSTCQGRAVPDDFPSHNDQERAETPNTEATEQGPSPHSDPAPANVATERRYPRRVHRRPERLM